MSDLVRDHTILFVHAAPPCGTCSMARSIKRKGVGAAPLRSPQYPMGLPSLQGSNLDKVLAANKIYVGLARFLDLLCSLKIPWTVENPESSLLWQLPCFEHLVRAYPMVSFDMCCFGGARLTHRSLLTSCPALDHLRQRCPGGHEHLPWKPFRKADGSMHFPTEAAYPRPFCQQFVLLVFRHLGRQLPLHPADVPSAVAAVSSARQPRGRKFAPVMPEYKRILTYQVHALPPVDAKRCLLEALRDAPPGSKLLSSTSLLTQAGDVCSSRSLLPTGSSSLVAEAPADGSGSHSCSSSSCDSVCSVCSSEPSTVPARPSVSGSVRATAIQPSSFEVSRPSVHSRSPAAAVHAKPSGTGLVSDTAVQPSSFEVRLGPFASPEEFVQDCRTVGHPFDRLHSVPDRLRQCLFDMLTHGPAWVVRRRANLLKKWTVWASELEFDEKELRDSLDPEVAKVLQGKRLLLLERIARSIGWTDTSVFVELRRGFDLIGHHKHSGVFAYEPRPPVVTEADFLDAAQFLRPALLGKIGASAGDAHAHELWSKTLEEVADGILEGPLTPAQLSERHGAHWVPTRRFGVEQSSSAGRKLRPVDDFTENRVNLAFGSMDKLDLNALDELICICRLWVRAIRGTGRVSMTLSCGTVLDGELHPGWHKAGADPLLTTLDLRAAYKQFALSAKSRAWSVIALLDPVKLIPGLFESKALPFGSSASVLHFNRLARLFWRIGVELFLPWCNFCADFPVMSPSGIAANTMDTMIALCNLLGFRFASDKLSPFSSLATVLGIEVDCTRAAESLILVRNKPGRAEELIDALESVLEAVP